MRSIALIASGVRNSHESKTSAPTDSEVAKEMSYTYVVAVSGVGLSRKLKDLARNGTSTFGTIVEAKLKELLTGRFDAD